MDWNEVIAIATVVSMVAYIVTAMYIRAELKALDKDRYLTVTSQMFSIWQTHEFMREQLWLLHELKETSWDEFVRAHRGDRGEAAFHHVGAFYDRIGTLVRLGFVRAEEILPTLGGYAIYVWQKIQPLVHEARRREHSTLFQDFERLLPACYECYAPSIRAAAPREGPATTSVRRTTLTELKQRLDRHEPLVLLDVRQPVSVAADPRTLPGAIVLPPQDVEQRHKELPTDREIVAFCA